MERRGYGPIIFASLQLLSTITEWEIEPSTRKLTDIVQTTVSAGFTFLSDIRW